ncbi:hypothetical protein [Escherichia coli]
MDKLEINDQFVVLLFEDKTGGPGDEMTMDKAIKRRSAEWSVSNTGLTGYIEGYNDCLQDHSDGK